MKFTFSTLGIRKIKFQHCPPLVFSFFLVEEKKFFSALRMLLRKKFNRGPFLIITSASVNLRATYAIVYITPVGWNFQILWCNMCKPNCWIIKKRASRKMLNSLPALKKKKNVNRFIHKWKSFDSIDKFTGEINRIFCCWHNISVNEHIANSSYAC